MAGPRKQYAFRPAPELDGRRGHYPVVIAGAGPVGMAAARDLALRGIRSIVLDDDDKVSVGSRAICWARRTLEIFERLGIASRMMQKGVTWNTGRVFSGDDREPVFSFDLSPDRDQCFPAFINLQQYYVEEYLVDVLDETPLTELRWQSKVSGVRQTSDSVEVTVQTPAGPYTVTADYLLAADGSRSTIRGLLGLEFVGEVFQDHFLIADVRMRAERPAERWFWFDPPFARGQSALLHKQPDDIWRLDFQLGWNIDREAELDPERIGARVRRMLGADVAFELEWASIYTFQCRRLARFVHDRVILPVMPRTSCRRSAHAAQMAAYRTSTTCAGNSRSCSRGPRRSRCSRAMTPSVDWRPTRTSVTRRAAPSSSRRSRRRAVPFARRSSSSRAITVLRGHTSTAGGCRCRRCCATRHCTRTPPHRRLARCRYRDRRPSMCRSRWTVVATGCCVTSAASSTWCCSSRQAPMRRTRRACPYR